MSLWSYSSSSCYLHRQDMKPVVCVLLTCLVLGAARAQQVMRDFGNGDITNLLKDNVLVQKQIRCVLDQGPCDQLGAMIKKVIPEVVNRNCKACSPRQATNARNLMNFIQSRYPQVWSAVVARYRG